MVTHDVEDGKLLPNVAELSEIVDSLPAMVALWDRDGRNRFANLAYIEWFGCTPDEARGMHISDLLGPRLFELNRPYIEGALAGIPQLFERSLIDTAGRTRHTQTTYSPRFIDGRAEGFFVLVTDITERVRAEAELANTMMEVSLSRERERIAADLHDVVIQRLFGVGLEVQHLLPSSTSEQRGSLESVLEGLDHAVRELRQTIANLNRRLDSTELTSAVDRVIEASSLMLGFRPVVVYLGSAAHIDSPANSDLLAVLTEALANVTRHAAATHVEITITTDEDAIELRVTDDGKGLHGSSRRSGLANMRWRAERLGGTFTCRPNDGTGTVLEWRVPTG